MPEHLLDSIRALGTLILKFLKHNIKALLLQSILDDQLLQIIRSLGILILNTLLIKLSEVLQGLFIDFLKSLLSLVFGFNLFE